MYVQTYVWVRTRARTHARLGFGSETDDAGQGCRFVRTRTPPGAAAAAATAAASSSSPLQCTLPSQVVSRRYWTLAPTYLHISCTLLSGSGVSLICSCK